MRPRDRPGPRIAPPAWRKAFDPLRDESNAEHGSSQPDDPARAAAQQPRHLASIEAARLPGGLKVEAARRDPIRAYLFLRVEHGTVRNRDEVVPALREAGLESPRQGKDYLTALDPETAIMARAADRQVCLPWPRGLSYLGLHWWLMESSDGHSH